MSAFIVANEHIAAMIHTAINGTSDSRPAHPQASAFAGSFSWYNPQHRREVLDLGSADQVGQMLLNENHASVNARYNEDEQPEEYRHVPPARKLTTAEAHKAIHCYEYQSCEHKGWKDSSARAFCELLRHHLITNMAGYDAAPWEIKYARIIRA